MSASELPAIRYLLYLCPGLLIGMCLKLPVFCIAGFLLIVFILILTVRTHKMASFLFAGCILISGMLRVSLSQESYEEKHHIPNGHSPAIIRIVEQKTSPYRVQSYVIKTKVNGRTIKGTLYARKNIPVLQAGKKYAVSDLKWEKITSDANPYVFDYLAYARTQGISHKFSLDKQAVITEKGVGHPVVYLSARVRNDISVRFLSVLGIEKGSLVNGLLLGLKSEIPDCISGLFRQLGVSHLLAVSGLHVGLIILILYQLLLTLNIPRVPRVLIIAVFLIFYCFLTGGSPSVIRSSLMSVMLISAPVFKRKYRALNAVAAAAVILLLINPLMIRDLGFQFSFSAVFGILIAYPKIRGLFPRKNINRISGYVLDMISVSLSAALFTSPVALFYFNSLQLASMFLNLLVIPLTFCVMICAILYLPGLFIHSFLADLVLHALDLSLSVFIRVLRLASASDIWTYHASSYYKPLIMAVVLIAVFLFCLPGKRSRTIFSALIAMICLAWFFVSTRPQLIQLELEKGQALLVRKKRYALIVNTGARYFAYNDHDRYIKPVLDQWGIREAGVVVTAWEKGYHSNIAFIRRNYPGCPVLIPETVEEPEQNYQRIARDTTLSQHGLNIVLHPESEGLSVDLKLGKEHVTFKNDTLSLNPACEYPKHYMSFHNYLFKLE